MSENCSSVRTDEIKAAIISQLRGGVAVGVRNVYVNVHTNEVEIGGVYRKNDSNVPGRPPTFDLQHAWVGEDFRRLGVMSIAVTSIIDAVREVKQAALPLVIYMTNDMIDGLSDAPAMRSFWKTYGGRNVWKLEDGDEQGFYETEKVTGYEICP